MPHSLLILWLVVTPAVSATSLVELHPFGIHWLKFVYVFGMGTWGALAVLLQRFASGQTERWVLVAVRDLVNANLAAVVTLLACEHAGVPPAPEAIAYTLAGYGGARFMEMVYRKFVRSKMV